MHCNDQSIQCAVLLHFCVSLKPTRAQSSPRMTEARLQAGSRLIVCRLKDAETVLFLTGSVDDSTLCPETRVGASNCTCSWSEESTKIHDNTPLGGDLPSAVLHVVQIPTAHAFAPNTLHLQDVIAIQFMYTEVGFTNSGSFQLHWQGLRSTGCTTMFFSTWKPWVLGRLREICCAHRVLLFELNHLCG